MLTSVLGIFTGPYAMLARLGVVALVAVSLFGYGWFKGNSHGTQKLIDYQAKQALEAVRIAQGRERVTTQVVTKYVQKAAETRVVTQYVEKEVVRYEQANPGYCLDADWRRLHDAAALNTVPNSPSGTDVPPRAAEALEGVTTNYAAAQRNADRLQALQEWVAKQQAVR